MAHLDFEKPLVELEERINALKGVLPGDTMSSEVADLEARAETLREELYADLNVMQKVQLSRHPDRPYFLDYLDIIFEDFVELHGDRAFRDDPAIVGGFARLDGKTVLVIGQQKGRTTKQKLMRNFGMAHPEGYRKACRLMDLAERFRKPIFTFIDTPGAYPGIGAEERGQSEAIGHSLLTMSRLRVPIIATVIGEGGSGGALGLGVANRLLMLQYATYSVITPEGCASILWRDGAQSARAAEQLKLLASHTQGLGIADEVIQEPRGGAHRNIEATAEAMRECLRRHLVELCELSPEALVAARYEKFRGIGHIVNG